MSKTPEQKRYESRLPHGDSKTAIYIDFEGFMSKPPTLVGWCCDQHFAQVVFDRALQSAAYAKGLPVQEGYRAISNLLARAKGERRRIVAFSQFDKNVAFNELGLDLSPVYADARLIGVQWLKRLKRRHPNWRSTNPNWDIDRNLKSFLELIGYHRPIHLGIEKTTSRIKHVKDQLITRGWSYDALTPVAKAKWTKLLDHNRHDVLGMIELVKKAIEGFVPT
jgi:hypothetical protein